MLMQRPARIGPAIAVCLVFLTVCKLTSGAAVSASATAASENLPPHPRLLLNQKGIEALKARIEDAAWAKASWQELKESADKALAKTIVLPPRGGNWSHNYVCPKHGARLSQGRKIDDWRWEHICPVGQHVLLGDPAKATTDFDGNSITGIHGDYAQEVLNEGLVYQVTGQGTYASRARQILLAYAEKYRTYPLHDNQGRQDGAGGHVSSQSLTEASWLITIVQGIDLIWAALSDEDRRQIETQLLRPCLEEVILPRRFGVHNIQCRHNSAIGLVGFLLGDAELVSIAIDDRANGFRRQLDKGVLDDGMWTEGSSGYHFFTIAGLWPLAEAARNCGIDLYDEKFCAMFEGPLALTMPNLVLPNFNDSGTVPLRNEADMYELAYARFGKNEFTRLISGSKRSGRLALLFGVEQLPSVHAGTAGGSHNLPGSGYAILQKGQGEQATWLCVKYGPHGGGHGHPDKNSFVLYSRGQVVATDAGTHPYGSALHRDWDKTTVAHNTLVMDEMSQAPAPGISLAFGSDHGIEYSMTDAGKIYPGVTFVRTVAMIDHDLVVFVDQIEATTPHTFDLAYHQSGKWADLEQVRSQHGFRVWLSPRVPGYAHFLRTASCTIAGENLVLRSDMEEGLHPALALAATGPTEVITGYGIGKTTEDFSPMLIQRRQTKATAFVWAIALDGIAPALEVKAVSDESGIVMPLSKVALVRGRKGQKEFSILVNPDETPFSRQTVVGFRGRGRFSVE